MKNLLLLLFLCNLTLALQANNIQVNNVSRTTFDATAKYAMVEFDLSWDNSWRTSVGPANWDAAWVFVKFRVGSVNPVLTGASSSGTTVTVSSTARLRVGMPVRVSAGTGAIDDTTVISSIVNGTSFILSEAPSTALSNATIECVRIWEHAYLDTTDANHSAPSGSTITVPNDSTGAFIYRSQNGYGSFSLTDVALRWKYGSNGLDLDSVFIKVFAIEMVYVPQGNFYVGDGSNQFNRLTQANSVTGNTVPFQITATPPTFQGNDVNSSASNLSARINGTTLEDFDLTGTNTATLATGYPTGYYAFYCMKYETSQGQYRDFLNSLTRVQQSNCIYTDGNVGTYTGGTFWRFDGTNNNSSTYFATINNAQVPGERNGVRIISDPGAGLPLVFGCDLNTSSSLPSGVNQSDDGEWVAMGCLSWMAACSYLDWCGLRPMTELEFEKACRGDQTPVAQEMPWGQTAAASNVTPDNTGLSGAGTSSETAAKTSANIHISDQIHGVIRSGAFADGSSTKVESGATYYGIMNFADNAWEFCVSVGCVAGRSYTGLHGDGSLLSNGRADVDFWPGINGNATESSANTAYSSMGVTKAAGAGRRGGIWPFSADLSEVSCRNHGVNNTTSAATYNGGRGVRSAP